MNFSNLLAAALSTADDTSDSFAFLVGQVTARCLASLRDPLPLAALLAHAEKENSSVALSPFLLPLISYARAILEFDNEDVEGRISLSGSFLTLFFDNDSPYSGISSLLAGMKSLETTQTRDGKSLMRLSPTGLLLFTKILNHTFLFSGDHADKKGRYWQIVRLVVPSILLVCS